MFKLKLTVTARIFTKPRLIGFKNSKFLTNNTSENRKDSRLDTQIKSDIVL